MTNPNKRTQSVSTPLFPLWVGLIIVLFGIIFIPYILGMNYPLMLIYIAALILMITAAIAILRYRTWGLGDPLLIFAVIFSIYNASMLMEYGVRTFSAPIIYYFGGVQSFDIFVHAGVSSTLAISGLLFGALLLSHRKSFSSGIGAGMLFGRKRAIKLFWMGFLLSVGAIITKLLIIRVSGGLNSYLSAVRIGVGSYRINPSVALGIGIPLGPMEIVGIACMAICAYFFPSRGRRALFVVLLVLLTLFEFLQGNRHLVVYIWIIAIGAYTTFVEIKWRNLRTIVILGIVGYGLLAFVSGTRSVLPGFFSGENTVSDVINAASSFSWRGLRPSQTEFGGPFYSLVYTVNAPSALHLGGTYFNAALAILPTRLYPGIKSKGVAGDFAQSAQMRLPTLAGVGFGFSPVAEAYINYSFPGIPLVFFLVALGWHWVGTLRRKGFQGMLVYLVIVPECINFNRISLDGVLQETAFALIIVWIVFQLSKVRWE